MSLDAEPILDSSTIIVTNCLNPVSLDKGSGAIHQSEVQGSQTKGPGGQYMSGSKDTGKADASVKEGENPNEKLPASTKLNNNELLINRFATTLKKLLADNPKGNFIIPIKNILFLLDLIDIIMLKIHNFQKIHIISSSSESLINYSNANVDYLNKILQNKIFMSSPELPLSINKLLEEDRIEFFPDINQFTDRVKAQLGYMADLTPSLYFVTDSSLRMGYSSKIYEIINTEFPQNSQIIFVDPYLDYKKVMYCLMPSNQLKIVDMRLNLNSTLSELIPIFMKSSCETI